MTLPHELIQSLQSVKGFQESSFRAVHESGEQVTAIRLNPAKQSVIQDKFTGQAIPWCPLGIYLNERPSFTFDPSFHAGAYYVQDASSMFLWEAISQLVPDPRNKKVLDLCAAPGGKSTLLASYFTDGLLVSNEVIKSRASILVENLTKWGNSNVVITNNDPVHFRQGGITFDVIVVDAPCSGSGLFRKDPDAISEWSLDHVQHCSLRQQRILDDIIPSLNENGILIYATCSYSLEEDEMIADWLMSSGEFEALSIAISEQWNIVQTFSEKMKAPGYRFYPDRLKGEGFFIAAFRKKTPAFALGKGKLSALKSPQKHEFAQVHEFLSAAENFYLFKQGDQFRLFDKQWQEELQQLASNLYIRKAGVGIGEIKGKDIIPAHELAMSLLPLAHFNQVAVNTDEALKYLRRQDLQLDTSKGWNLVMYEHLPLGWIKALPNRINNYYPQEWRILKQ
ncbi:rRNA cytosine-C5-methyltransferase [Sediminibacterium sp. KACHI17]|uniref:rRNA cytosine-C5-methyltransferase n=1 Tax=Sediminibacterium sp. KACHI17 TaxID=1751071 RepID=A0AAT9GMJ2_9BACT